MSRALMSALLTVALAVPVAAPSSEGSLDTQIYNGRDVEDGEYPEVALVEVLGPEAEDPGDDEAIRCTGTLVAPKWVLTAAHCLDRVEPHRAAVAIGAETESELRVEETYEVVAEDVVHPDYDVVSAVRGDSFVADVALLRVDEQGGPTATLARESPRPGDLGDIVGWGMTGRNTTAGPPMVPSRLQVASVPVRSDEVCETAFGNNFVAEATVCAGEGEADSPDACSGDSGGPMFAEGTKEVIGITSYGGTIEFVPHCSGSSLGAYTDVSAYAGWIDTVTDTEVFPTRLAGRDRVATAIEVASRWEPEETDRVLLATARAFPDALAAGGLATAWDAPLLLVEPRGLGDDVAAEIERLTPDELVILGGEGAVPESVADTVDDLDTHAEVRRIGGADRYETAAAIARHVGTAAADDPVRGAVVAAGADFPDALSAGGLLGGDEPLPVLLSPPDELSDPTLEALRELGVEDVTLVGGAAALSDDVEGALDDAGFAVDRLGGGDRYETSLLVAAEGLERLGTEAEVLVGASGRDYPDALTAGVLAGREGGVLALLPEDEPRDGTEVALKSATWSTFFVVGGRSARSQSAVYQFAATLRPTPVEDDF